MRISSAVTLPLKTIGACIITFCIYLGMRYILQGFSERDFLKAGAAVILLGFPAFFTHHLLILKFLSFNKNKIQVHDIFYVSESAREDITSFRRLNFFVYEIIMRDGKKINTIYFVLSRKEEQRIREILGKI